MEIIKRNKTFQVGVKIKIPFIKFSRGIEAEIGKSSRSARFVPNEMIEIAEVPRTLSGKKLEVPVKKLLLGGDPDKIVNRDSMANPESFDTFIAYAKTLNDNMKKEN